MVRSVGKWVGGNTTFACGALTSVGELDAGTPSFQLAPNPTQGILHVLDLPANAHHAKVHDLAGRELLHQRLYHAPVDVQALAAGTYLITVFDRAGLSLGTQRFVRE